MTASTTNDPHRQKHMFAMFGVLLIAYVVNAMDRQVFPILLPEVREEYGFGDAGAGLQSTFFALGMGLSGIPVGYLITRVRRKTLLLLGTFLFSAVTVLTVVSAGFWDMLFWRAASGVGESLQLTALLAIAAAAFQKYRGTAIGTVNVAFAAGSLIGPALGGHLLSAYGSWRAPMLLFGLIGAGALVLVSLAVRPWFSEARADGGHGVRTVGGAPGLRNRNTAILAAVTVLGGLIDFGYIGMYPSFLRDELGYSPTRAGLVVGLSGLAALLSSAGGYLGDRYDPRAVLGGFLLLTAVAAVALFTGPTALWWQAVWSFVFGLAFSSGVFVNLAGYLVASVRGDLAGRASGLFVSAIYIPAGFAGYLFSLLAGATSWPAAGLVQLAALSAAAALLAALGLRPAGFARPAPAPDPGPLATAS
ncbi:MFS transporter [Actinomadura roseirufa]|uniref:MFS transporter n=1 Tax=Actinomadura roseirufa TaxID=2094049 RepID=UPI00104114EE